MRRNKTTAVAEPEPQWQEAPEADAQDTTPETPPDGQAEAEPQEEPGTQTEQPTRETPAANGDIVARRRELRDRLALLELDHEFWRTIMDGSQMRGLVDGLRREIEAKKEKLTDITLKADQTVALRAEIIAYRDLLARLDYLASDEPITHAAQDLHRFEDENSLFLAHQKELEAETENPDEGATDAPDAPAPEAEDIEGGETEEDAVPVGGSDEQISRSYRARRAAQHGQRAHTLQARE